MDIKLRKKKGITTRGRPRFNEEAAKVQLNISVDADLKTDLETISRVSGESISSIVNQIIKNILRMNKHENKPKNIQRDHSCRPRKTN